MGGGEVRVGSGIEYDSNKRELVVLILIIRISCYSLLSYPERFASLN